MMVMGNNLNYDRKTLWPEERQKQPAGSYSYNSVLRVSLTCVSKAVKWSLGAGKEGALSGADLQGDSPGSPQQAYFLIEGL